MQRKPGLTIAAWMALLALLLPLPLTAQMPHDAVFLNRDRQPVALSAFRGKATLLVLWATWCAPCQRDMPLLDRLAGERRDINVVPVAADAGGLPVVQDYYAAREFSALQLYIDPQGLVGRALGVRQLPCAIMLDAQGLERGRIYGELEPRQLTALLAR